MAVLVHFGFLQRPFGFEEDILWDGNQIFWERSILQQPLLQTSSPRNESAVDSFWVLLV